MGISLKGFGGGDSGGSGSGASVSGLSALPPAAAEVRLPPEPAQVGGPAGSQTFSYTGTDQTFTIPSGLIRVNVTMWGAGGGNGTGTGGGGGYASGTINLAGKTELTVVVGQGGTTSSRVARYGGGGKSGTGAGTGGGLSGIFDGTFTFANSILIAGGGGGGTAQVTQQAGAGGGASGSNGTAYSADSNSYGRGATQSTGGAAGAGSRSQGAGTAGSQLTGGDAPASWGPGGGGAGYYGGGGAGGYYGAGGGGSGYIGHADVSNGVNTAGSGSTPGNSGHPDRGTAGNVNADGLVIISWDAYGPDGAAPVWTTAAGSIGTFFENSTINEAVLATDAQTVSYSIISGALPNGITLNTSTGSISGTLPLVTGPTVFNFTIEASDGWDMSTRAFSMTVDDAPIATVYNAPGGYTVDVSSLSIITAKLWGGAGGGNVGVLSGGGMGGPGGYASGTIDTSALTTLTIVVGNGGAQNVFTNTTYGGGGGGGDAPYYYGGGHQGGGYAGIFKNNSVSQSNALLIAGGGGGLGENHGYRAGRGGAAIGEQGAGNWDGSPQAQGGSQVAGGAGGVGRVGAGAAGVALAGGRANQNANGAGGGGGGGYYGGGAGGNYYGAGAGGSNYVGATEVSGATSTRSASTTLPDNTGDADYVVGAGTSGINAAGGNALVVIIS